jgi:hypothetical protein
MVRPGTQLPGGKFEIGGWVGRVATIDVEGQSFVCDLLPDSLTAPKMPVELMLQRHHDGKDWRTVTLSAADLEPTEARDEVDDVERFLAKIVKRHPELAPKDVESVTFEF